MAGQFYFARHGEQFGPFSAAQLKELAASGKLQPTDSVWKEGMTKRVIATKVKDLFPAPQAAAPPASTDTPAADTLAPPPPPVGDRSEAPSPEPGEQPAVAEPAPEAESAEFPPTAEAPPVPVEAPPSRNPPSPPRPPVRKLRAEGVRGAIIISQDGTIVHFRKKCTTCGFEDLSKSSMPIRTGSLRATFFCRKCRRLRDVELRGMA
jgi:hypothetical protein